GEVVPNADRRMRIVLPKHLDRAALTARLHQGRRERAGLHDFVLRVDDAEHGAVALDRAGIADRLDVERDAAVLRLDPSPSSSGGPPLCPTRRDTGLFGISIEIGMFWLCMRGTSPPSTGANPSSART